MLKRNEVGLELPRSHTTWSQVRVLWKLIIVVSTYYSMYFRAITYTYHRNAIIRITQSETRIIAWAAGVSNPYLSSIYASTNLVALNSNTGQIYQLLFLPTTKWMEGSLACQINQTADGGQIVYSRQPVCMLVEGQPSCVFTLMKTGASCSKYHWDFMHVSSWYLRTMHPTCFSWEAPISSYFNLDTSKFCTPNTQSAVCCNACPSGHMSFSH